MMLQILGMVPAVISTALALIVVMSVVVSMHVYQDEVDGLERFLWGGLAGSMFLTTPAIWIHSGTPFDDWAFNVSRAFLTALCVKRLIVPVWWKIVAKRRDTEQIRQSGARLVDRLRHKL